MLEPDNRPLYEDSEIKIDIHPRTIDDHLISLRSHEKKDSEYFLQRGVLKEFATTSRDWLGLKMRTYNEFMVIDAKERGLSVDSLGLAMAQAYIEEEQRIRDIASTLRE